MSNAALITVIGSGVVGLTTAVRLLERGRCVKVIADRARHPAASVVAPALFTPYAGAAPERLRRWTTESLRMYRHMAATEDPTKTGVRIRPLREYFYKPSELPEWLDEVTMPTPIRPVPTGLHDAHASDRPHIDMTRFLPYLERRVADLGGQSRVQSVERFDQIESRLIINCAGLGARRLADDPRIQPMHGQVIHAPNDIGIDYSIHDDAPAGLVAYIFTFDQHLVLGGTFVDNRNDDATDQATIDAILDRCRKLLRLDGFPNWERLGRNEIRRAAARRPTRVAPGTYEDIRVEVENLGDKIVIHNYGHGRSGVTQAWGTAAEVVALVDNVL